ncbi:MAG: hypothetical protein ACHP78_00175 [Terriglobales bacterium]
MDDNPRAFLEELKHSIFRRSVGKIALAVVFAMAVMRFISNLIWYLVIPILNEFFRQSGSVLFPKERQFPVVQLFGSVMEFAGAVIAVFYLSRWVQKKPREAAIGQAEQLELGLEPEEPALQVALGSLAEEANRRDARTDGTP